jgi:hypothetical protein
MMISPALWNRQLRLVTWTFVLALGLTGLSSHAQVLYQDDFNRADSVNDLGFATNGLGAPLAWSIQRDPDNDPENPYNTNPALGASAEIFSNKLLLNSAGQEAGAPQNNNDMLSLYVDFDLDAVPTYSITFDYTHLHAHQYDLSQIGSQTAGGFFILPRAEGADFPTNMGYVIRRISDDPSSPLAVYFYNGTERSGSPANIPIGTLELVPGDTSSFLLDQELTIRLDIYGVSGELARLTINGMLIDEDRDIGASYNNGTADHILLGYNALGTGQRRLVATIDNLVVAVPEPFTGTLLILGLTAVALRARTRRRSAAL